MPAISFSSAGTACRFNSYDERFKGQNLAATRRKKWAEKYLSMVRRATPQAPPRLFGRFLEVVRFSEVLAFRGRVALRDAAFVLRSRKRSRDQVARPCWRPPPGLIAQTGVNWGQLTAIGTVVALPMATAGLAAKRYLVRALTLGAVTKGEGECV